VKKNGRKKGVKRRRGCRMVYGKEELDKMIGEMGNKIMERLSEELGKLKIWQREKEWSEEKREMGLKIESLEKRVLKLEARVGGR